MQLWWLAGVEAAGPFPQDDSFVGLLRAMRVLPGGAIRPEAALGLAALAPAGVDGSTFGRKGGLGLQFWGGVAVYGTGNACVMYV